MLNYSEEQYIADRKAIKGKAQKALDEKMIVWRKVSKKCKISHIINPKPHQKQAAADFRKAEKAIAEDIAKIVNKNTLTIDELSE